MQRKTLTIKQIKESQKKKKKRQKWWRDLSDDDKQAYIAKRERERKGARLNKPLPKPKHWRNSLGLFTKTWVNHDQYVVTRERLDEISEHGIM